MKDPVGNTAGITFLPGHPLRPSSDVKEGDEVALFGEWHVDRHWSVRLGVDNLFNAIYPQGINAIVQRSQPSIGECPGHLPVLETENGEWRILPKLRQHGRVARDVGMNRRRGPEPDSTSGGPR